MGLRDTLNESHRALVDAKVEHALIGGLALAALGVHRATFDVDFLIDGKRKEAAANALVGAGWTLSKETKEVLHFSDRGSVDILLANRPLSLEMLANAKPGFDSIKCVSPEGIIGLKLQAYSNDKEREFQDKADIRSLVRKYPNMDWTRIKQYADLFGEWPFVDSLRDKNEL